MARRLSRRQAWRQEKIQEERRKRAERKAARQEEALAGGELGPEQPGLVVANYGNSLDIEDTLGILHRCLIRQNLGALVVGDRVVWQASHDGGVVTALEPRGTLLARPDEYGEHRLLAANIDQIVVVAAPQPRYSTELIDQYLIAAETTGIEPVILLNKIDLLNREERARIEEAFGYYQELGYRLLYASSKERHGLDTLVECLKGRISVFAGQSGVGKSSLVKALLPEEEIAVGSLSEGSGLGRHTTSASRLYHLPSGGSIIDSPGVREFRLWPMERHELVKGFREFVPYLGLCRFRDCRHLQEPGCALREALERGEIAVSRFESFLHIAEEMDQALAEARLRSGEGG